MAYQQGPPGQPPHSGPPPGYGYPPPPKKSSGPIILLVVGIAAVVLLGSCAALVAIVGSNTPEVVTATAPPAKKLPLAESTGGDGVTSEAPAETQQAAATVGGALTLRGNDPGLQMEVTVTKVVERATPANEFLKPKAGNRLVAVELQLHNTGQAVYSDSPSNGAVLIDDQGQQYRSSLFDVREGVSLTSATISKGDSRKGVIVYEVPDGTKLAKFQLGLNSGFAPQKGEWVIS